MVETISFGRTTLGGHPILVRRITPEGGMRLQTSYLASGGVRHQVLGPRARRWQVQAVVLSEKASSLDVFRKLFQRSNAFILHSSYGDTLRVFCQNWALHQSARKRAWTELHLTLVEEETHAETRQLTAAPERVREQVQQVEDGFHKSLTPIWEDLDGTSASQLPGGFAARTFQSGLYESILSTVQDVLDRYASMRAFLENPLGGQIGTYLTDFGSLAAQLRHLSRPVSLNLQDASVVLESFRFPYRRPGASRENPGSQALSEATRSSLRAYGEFALAANVLRPVLEASVPPETEQDARHFRQTLTRSLERIGRGVAGEALKSDIEALIQLASNFMTERLERIPEEETLTIETPVTQLAFVYHRYPDGALTRLEALRERRVFEDYFFISPGLLRAARNA